MDQNRSGNGHSLGEIVGGLASDVQDLVKGEIALARVELELQQHRTPGQILDDVMAYFRDSGGGDFGRNLMTSVRNNPLPAAVTGIGLAWLMVSGSGATADMGNGVRSGTRLAILAQLLIRP